MIQALLIKTVIKQVIKAIKKTDDKVIASNHEKRIKKLEDMAHPPRDFVLCEKCKNKIKEK
tara:strand:+ start:1060 stop:1242 length:183 start_codon:yes stop_codon:yes gene_type:complete